MLRQYDIVRITSLPSSKASNGLQLNRRAPRLGDIATIVEVYADPVPGYDLECTTEDGTEWLCSFTAEEIELELVRRPEIDS